jgi:hypothetical protein
LGSARAQARTSSPASVATIPRLGYLVSGPITGGTGRFAGATGFLVWRGTVDPVAFTFTDVVSGWISAPGEDDRDD